MISVAIKMLIGNRAACLGAIFGIFLATLLITQQSAIFLGLVSRSYRLVTDIPAPNVWVVDPKTESDMKVRGIPATYLDVVRSIAGIEWAVPLQITDIPIITGNRSFNIAQLYGVDDGSLVGAPEEILEGNALDLRRPGGVIIDTYSAQTTLAKEVDGHKEPLRLGDQLEINGNHAVVVGIAKITQGFYPQPIVFTSNTNFETFTSFPNKNIEFIAVKTKPDADIDAVLEKINSYPVLNGLTKSELERRMALSFLKTGILLNFGLSVLLGIIIGFSIAGQTFYIMTMNNIKYYSLIKALGGKEKMLHKMILVQTFIVGIIGFILGTGATLLWGMAVKDTTLAFLFPWQLLFLTGFIAAIICLFTAAISIGKVLQTDPKVLLGN